MYTYMYIYREICISASVYIQELRNSATGPILVKGISKQHHFLMLFFDFVCKPPSQLSFILGRVWEPSWDQVSANSTFFFMIFLDLVCKTNQKIYQKSIKNLSKTCQNQSKICQNRSLRSSWSHLDPKTTPRANKTAKSRFAGPPGTPKLEAKIYQKSRKRRCKM